MIRLGVRDQKVRSCLSLRIYSVYTDSLISSITTLVNHVDLMLRSNRSRTEMYEKPIDDNLSDSLSYSVRSQTIEEGGM